MAELAFAEGDTEAAESLAERRLRHLPVPDRLERAAALELLVRVRVARGHTQAAVGALAELTATAELAGTIPLLASGRYAGGLLALAQGDGESARSLLEDAVDLYTQGGAPFEAARARIELARALRAIGRDDAATRELTAADDVLTRMGAALEAVRAATLLAHREDASPASIAGFTDREAEVLRLVAAGASNQEVAAQLYLSTRTVERHVSSIYEKLELSGRNARAAAAAWAFTHGHATSTGR